jgi:hypothetical protein
MKTSLLFVILFIFVEAHGQNVDLSLISSTGSFGSTNAIHLSWSVGQVEFETGQSVSFHLTQGFEQPLDSFVAVSVQDSLPNLRYTVFPNPCSDYAQLEVETSEGVSWRLTDVVGNTLIACRRNDQKTYRIETSALAKGLYFLLVNDLNGSYSHCFKLEKI